jgi:hypothetical protein
VVDDLGQSDADGYEVGAGCCDMWRLGKG